MTDNIINRATLKIAKSNISSKMLELVTKKLIDDCWYNILQEVPYASTAINLIEKRQIYDGAKLLVGSEDSVIKPDHTAARGFVDSSKPPIDYSKFDPKTSSFEELLAHFPADSGTALTCLIIQMIGGKISSNICNFPNMKAAGTHLYFNTNHNIILDHTKHFISSQDIELLDEPYKTAIRNAIKNARPKLTPQDWHMLQRIYRGEELGHNELASLKEILFDRTFGRMWDIDIKVAKILQDGADKGEKPMEYAFSTYLRGNMLNHGTWRVSDILRAQGALSFIGAKPIKVRGMSTYLEQTAGMAAKTDYQCKDGSIINAPGAFLEVASRPYMLLGSNDLPVNIKGEYVDIEKDQQPYLLHELTIELDVSRWRDDKLFVTADGKVLSLGEINKGVLGNNTRLSKSQGKALCYEGFKEANAAGIFFAAGGNVKNMM